MADGWTGINVEEVKAQLNNFWEQMGSLAQSYVDAFDLFNTELFKTWGSDNAVKFNTNLLSLSEIKRVLYEVQNKVITAASEAAKFMAEHNGSVFNFVFGPQMVSADYKPLQEEINGVKGMNIPLAKLAVDTFDATVKGILNALLALPLGFGLYDPAQELLNQYKNMVTTTAQWVSDSVQDALNWVRGIFEDETLQIEVGKAEAEEELTVNPTTGIAPSGIDVFGWLGQGSTPHSMSGTGSNGSSNPGTYTDSRILTTDRNPDGSYYVGNNQASQGAAAATTDAAKNNSDAYADILGWTGSWFN